MKKYILFCIIFWVGVANGMHLDVIDLKNTPEKDRLLVLSLQGNTNRDSAHLYIIWEDVWDHITSLSTTPTERWLEYYESKGWITYGSLSMDSALNKYKNDVSGYIIYDPNFRHSINIAFSMGGIDSAIVAHPDFINKLDSLEIPQIRDLRGMWSDSIEAYIWQRDSLFPYCSKDMIAMMLTDNPWGWWWECAHCQKDYVIINNVCVVDLSPNPDDTTEYELLKTYYEQMDPFGSVLGWPATFIDQVNEAWHVHLASKYNLMLMQGKYDAVNFSVHSKMPADTIYHQSHVGTVTLDTTKIYCTFVMIDGGGNMMQNRFYNAWDDPMRGSIPLNWYFEPVFRNHCPGIYEHYYETKTANDYFIAGFGLGYIYPSDFLLLDQYLNQAKSRMSECDLKVLALINGMRMDEDIISAYTSILDNSLGLTQGYTGTEFGWINTANYRFSDNIPWIITSPIVTETIDTSVTVLDSVIKDFGERPLFLCSGVHLFCFNVDSVKTIMERLNNLHPGELNFVKLDEFMLALKAYKTLLDSSNYTCDSLGIIFGSLVSGDYTSLHSIDNNYLVINTAYYNWFYVTYHISDSVSKVKRLWMTYYGHSSDSVYNYIYIWNYVIANWELLGWRSVYNIDRLHQDGVIHNVGDYISDLGEVRIAVIQEGEGPFTSYTDYLGLDVFYKNGTGFEESANNKQKGVKIQNARLEIYSNPFCDKTEIKFLVARTGWVELKIYDTNGRLVKKLVNKQYRAGSYVIKWNGTGEDNKDLSSGIYFVKLKVGDDFKQTKKILLLR